MLRLLKRRRAAVALDALRCRRERLAADLACRTARHLPREDVARDLRATTAEILRREIEA
jgi:hypothetical protein